MTAITIGNTVSDRAQAQDGWDNTWIDTNAPASGTGTLTSASVWLTGASEKSSFKFGTFSGGGTSWTYRASRDVGPVATGSVQTFTGLSIAVVAGDCLGFHNVTANANVEASYNVGATCYYKAGDHMTAEGAQTYGAQVDTHSVSASGTVPVISFTPISRIAAAQLIGAM